MLYNPEWKAPSYDPELDRLINWLETMPADKRYGTKLAWTCLMGQYVRATRPYGTISTLRWLGQVGGESNRLYEYYKTIVLPKNAWRRRERTFGAALRRAQAQRISQHSSQSLSLG